MAQVIMEAFPGDWPENLTSFSDWHANEYSMSSKTWDASRGSDAPFDPGQEWNQIMLGALLVEHGVNSEGLIAWDTGGGGQTWADVGVTWHRSRDEYGPMARAERNLACKAISNDKPICDPDVPDGITAHDGGNYWHMGYYTRIKDEGPEAWMGALMGLSPAFLFEDPDFRLTYYCPSFGNTSVYVAGATIHEGWHRTAFAPHQETPRRRIPGRKRNSGYDLNSA